MAERITSRGNPLMTHIRKLAASRAYRRETGEYLGDGVKLLAEAAHWDAALTAVVYTPETALPDLPAGVRLVEVPRELMASISPMEAPQGRDFFHIFCNNLRNLCIMLILCFTSLEENIIIFCTTTGYRIGMRIQGICFKTLQSFFI